jgi:hypothetical protein
VSSGAGVVSPGPQSQHYGQCDCCSRVQVHRSEKIEWNVTVSSPWFLLVSHMTC